ncbi:MAG: hypothetical protein ABJA62_00920 [Luteimonas sp.]
MQVDMVVGVDLDLHLHGVFLMPAHLASDLRMDASSRRRFEVVTG